jgi:hypothetical protein
MAPTPSRGQPTANYLQAQPFIADAPPFQQNPYFTKYDITSDPRNIAREVRGAVYEDLSQKGVNESERLFTRGFDALTQQVSEMDKERQKALTDYEFMKPRIQNMQQNYRKGSN